MFQYRKLISSLAIIFILINGFKPQSAEAKFSPGIAGGLSFVPGLGQISNGDSLEGLGWFTGIVGGFLVTSGNTYNQTVFLDLWMYNMYDAYRDAGAPHSAKNNLIQNYVSAFNPMNVLGVYSFIPLAYQAVTVSQKGHDNIALGPDNKLLTPVYMGFIAMGEEALFRGFIFPGFSDLMGGSAVIGGITSSVAFAAAHALYNGQSSYALQPRIFALRTILGLFYCKQTYDDHYDLRKSIFSHTWFDVLYDWDRQGMPGGGKSPQISGFTIKTQISL